MIMILNAFFGTGDYCWLSDSQEDDDRLVQGELGRSDTDFQQNIFLTVFRKRHPKAGDVKHSDYPDLYLRFLGWFTWNVQIE